MKFLNKIIHELVRKGFRHSKFRWLFILASVVYLISPLDISPDVFPVLGWLDDGVIITLLATEVAQFLNERRQARKEDANSTSTATSSSVN